MNIAEVFKALGDPTRLNIIKLIMGKGNNLCVGMIARLLDISQPAVSQHLRILKNSDLVEANRRGFHVHYSVKKDRLRAYGINIDTVLQSINSTIKPEDSCKFNGNNKKCM
ncbi:MAG: helix-turn-helix transcriptional regulator [Spirochaetales bacterium]|nr:helix-turn-helix transcriptional regulator [Spirochaetales bacterium]